MGIKRFITCHVPVDTCNFRCSYCYLDHLGVKDNKISNFCTSVKNIAEFFSPSRTGGTCYFNLCGNGETMIHPQLVDLIDSLTKEGHYCDIITNGTMSLTFDKLINRLSAEQLSRLFVKFSFHYLELIRTNTMPIFLNNVNKIKNSPASFSIEITPNDELVNYINEIKDFSIKHFGAFPHITVTREEYTKKIKLLTKYNRDKYKDIRSCFDSDLFNFKIKVFGEKRNEFCYAGDWSIEVDLKSGNYFQCYHGKLLGNIKDLDHDINFKAIGRCPIAHCFNSHAFLAFGDIPSLKDVPTYCDERDRITIDGSHWLKEECRNFFSTKLYENNKKYNVLKRGKIYFVSTVSLATKIKISRIKSFVKRNFNAK